MCGINAVIHGKLSQIEAMAKASSNRGVKTTLHDVAGSYVHFNWLPITDPNAQPQPFTHDGNIVYLNGYISNWKELAKKYSIDMVSNCDTELLTKFLSAFGWTKVDELNGFFAVLWFDGTRWKTFTDRYGIKKLYTYTDTAGTKFIASEIKSILAVNPQIELSKDAIEDFKYSLGVMNENSLYEGITRVKSLPFRIPEKIKISYEDAKSKLTGLLLKSFERNKTELNDCVFLSGGIDSGIIANYMKPKFSFSMDYVDWRFSETENIKRNSTGIHYSMICNKELFGQYLSKVMNALDDPKVGSSYTNFALTELASKFATVIYSGAGGDEFFGGYPHRLNKDINQVIKRTSFDGLHYVLSHFDYDLKFLRGVLNVEDSIAGYHTMETRYPLLDNDLVDFALSLPDKYLKDKKILKEISELHPLVLNSTKKGFSNPFISNDEWTEFVTNYIKNKHERRSIQP